MRWSNHVRTANEPTIEKSLEASVAYSAFLASGVDGAEEVSFSQFRSEYFKTSGSDAAKPLGDKFQGEM